MYGIESVLFEFDVRGAEDVEESYFGIRKRVLGMRFLPSFLQFHGKKHVAHKPSRDIYYVLVARDQCILNDFPVVSAAKMAVYIFFGDEDFVKTILGVKTKIS